MDPPHFLSRQAFQNHHLDKPNRAEIEAFYDLHGLEVFAALSHWRVRLRTAWLRTRYRQDRPAGFAPEAHRG